MPKTTLFLKANHENTRSQINVARYKFAKIMKNATSNPIQCLKIHQLIFVQQLIYYNIENMIIDIVEKMFF